MYHWIGRRLSWLLIALAAVVCGAGQADPYDSCAVCGGPLGIRIYLWPDKVTGDVKRLCSNCTVLPSVCYLCGVPVKKDYRELPDGRILCDRDVRSVVLDSTDGRQIFDAVTETLNRSYSRFITFPAGNVGFGLTDRVNIQNMFKFAGNDYSCPNVWGYYQMNPKPTEDNAHLIAVLSGLPRSAFRATCAHELTHAWVHENVSATRVQRLSHDAQEAFCELIAYNLAVEQNDPVAKKQILENQYTRGEINVFIAAQERFGFNDVVDWVKYGEDDHLDATNLEHVHRLTEPRLREYIPPRAPVIHYPPAPPPPDRLVLKGIFWAAKPSASINGRLLAENESLRVPLATSNILVRCLSIREDEVHVQLVDSGEKQVLKFKE